MRSAAFSMLSRWVSVLVVLAAAGASRADIAPPPVRGDNPKNERIGYAIENLQHSNVPVQVNYSASATRITMTIPERYVSQARKVGLLEFDSQAGDSTDPTRSRNSFTFGKVIAGIALALFFIALGILLIRGRSSVIIRIVVGAGAIFGVILVLATFLVWNWLSGPENTTSLPGGVRTTNLGIDVTIVAEGQRVDFVVPENLRPPPRNRNRDRDDKDGKK